MVHIIHVIRKMGKDKEIRQIQAQEYKIVDCGSYTIKRPLMYHEAEELLKKRKEGLKKWFY